MDGVFDVFERYVQFMKTLLNQKSTQDEHSLSDFFLMLSQSPEKLLHYQSKYLSKCAAYLTTSTSFRDKRFVHRAWKENAYFQFVSSFFLFYSQFLMEVLEEEKDYFSTHEYRKLRFLMRCWLDALSPGNFLLTNPVALEECVTSGGKSIVRGMENFLDDVSENRLSLVPEGSFALGKNLANTPGKVIYKNRLVELIHYTPLQESVYEIPVFIVPPCINKYYILDLNEEVSFVRWLLSKGYDVLMLSWVNPDGTMGDLSFEDYVLEGILQPLKFAVKQYRYQGFNLIGYCLGGVFTTALLSHLETCGDRQLIRSVTLLATLLDYQEVGDMEFFVGRQEIKQFKEEMLGKGCISGEDMHLAFNWLRANDIIWKTVIERYLLGQETRPVEMLFWHSDSTNLPVTMYLEYLKHTYIENSFAKRRTKKIGNLSIDLRKIETPFCFVAALTDHISIWSSVYQGMHLLPKSNKKFILSGSGHIAGIINPPKQHKYCFWSSSQQRNVAASPHEWLEKARKVSGSWWEEWNLWNQSRCGIQKCVTPILKKQENHSLGQAPGTYVLQRI